MNGVFVDTSALLALVVPTDTAHTLARRAFKELAAEEAALLTTSYVLVETYALLGRRFGLQAVRRFRADFEPLLEIVWIASDHHEQALDLLASERRASLSLVDATSFVVARARGIERVFAYDRHFDQQGFRRV